MNKQITTLQANWPAPDNIVAFTTLRTAGVSQPPFDGLNLGEHVGDSQKAVSINRMLLKNQSNGLHNLQWLNQIHSNYVIKASVESTIGTSPDADACYTQENGVACTIMTADCLPVLICDKRGLQVAAAHAGWRGLVSGIIENTVKSFSTKAGQLLVWLGPAISKKHFEVGAEVREAFVKVHAENAQAFYVNPKCPSHYFADLYELARLCLIRMGITDIYGGEHCSFAEHEQFFSYRRDKTTGRMASLIYKRVN